MFQRTYMKCISTEWTKNLVSAIIQKFKEALMPYDFCYKINFGNKMKATMNDVKHVCHLIYNEAVKRRHLRCLRKQKSWAWSGIEEAVNSLLLHQGGLQLLTNTHCHVHSLWNCERIPKPVYSKIKHENHSMVTTFIWTCTRDVIELWLTH